MNLTVIVVLLFASIYGVYPAPNRRRGGGLSKREMPRGVIGTIRTAKGAKDPKNSNEKQEIKEETQDIPEDTIDTVTVGDSDDVGGTNRASGGKTGVTLWPAGILYYQLDADLPDDTKTAIADAMSHIAFYTCIRFVERTGSEKNYVTFYEGSKGDCSSSLGMDGGEQKTSLGEGCGYMGTVAHEILHILGFNHEQNRADRDDYVTIEWDNIKDEAQANFKKFGKAWALTGGQPYDYSSIMHYGQQSFVKDFDLYSITCPEEEECEIIGQRAGLSDYDIKKVQSEYDCPEVTLATEASDTVTESQFETTEYYEEDEEAEDPEDSYYGYDVDQNHPNQQQWGPQQWGGQPQHQRGGKMPGGPKGRK